MTPWSALFFFISVPNLFVAWFHNFNRLKWIFILMITLHFLARTFLCMLSCKLHNFQSYYLIFLQMHFTCNYLTNSTNPCATSFKVQSLTAYVQVVWLKVELCRLLEEKRAAVLRLEPCSFCIYLVKMKDLLKINE